MVTRVGGRWAVEELVRIALPACRAAADHGRRRGPGRPPVIPDWAIMVLIVVAVRIVAAASRLNIGFWRRVVSILARRTRNAVNVVSDANIATSDASSFKHSRLDGCSPAEPPRLSPSTNGLKSLLDLHKRTWHRGLDNNRTQLLVAIFCYQLLLHLNRRHHRNNGQVQWILEILGITGRPLKQAVPPVVPEFSRSGLRLLGSWCIRWLRCGGT